MTDETKIQSFADFWPYYLGEHRNPTNRALHYVGTSAAIGIVVYAIAIGPPALGLWALLAGYGCAWIGHFRIEHNRPATFTYPRWSLWGDFKMLFYFLTGRIGGEFVRLYGSTHPSADTPLKVNASGTELSQ
jgi:hypothetical protein